MIGRHLVLTGLMLTLTACGQPVSGSETTDDCADNAACAAPPAASAPTPSPTASSAAPEPLQAGPVSVAFDRADAPDGQNTVPLPTTYLGPADPDDTGIDRLILRIEYPDLCQTLEGVHVVETTDTVTVTAVGTPRPEGPCPLRLLIGTGTVPLDAPLGDRTVTVAP